MKRVIQVAFGLSFLFLCLFMSGITDTGQIILRGKTPPGIGQFQLDDIYMGVALATWVYGLAPCVLLALVGTALALVGRFKHLNW